MDDLRERVAAVERALTDGEGDLQALAAGAASADRLDSLEAELGELQEDVAELEAATQALRGYVGSVRSVNESVEERADAALAAVDSLEEQLPDERKLGPASGESPGADANPGPVLGTTLGGLKQGEATASRAAHSVARVGNPSRGRRRPTEDAFLHGLAQTRQGQAARRTTIGPDPARGLGATETPPASIPTRPDRR